ncbi:MAG: cytochrome c biogenesis protein CcdA [Spirochaetota bacterium]
MNLELHFFTAFIAGLLSFLSPCILPLIPSYLSFIGGISYHDLNEKKVSRLNIFFKTLFFVLGFSIIFITLGVIFSSTGILLSKVSQIVNLAAGILVILLGVNFIFDIWKTLNIEKRFHFSRSPSGIFGSILLGMAFAAGWTPCVGPILASILFLAGTGDKVLQGTLLLTVYSAGLGLPFLMGGLFFSQFLKQAEKIKLHLKKIKTISGIFLVLIGISILLGRLQKLNIFLFSWANTLESWRQSRPGVLRLFFSLLFALPVFALAYFYFKKVNTHKKFLFQPVTFSFILLFLIFAVFTLAGVIDPAEFLTFWFTFRGI